MAEIDTKEVGVVKQQATKALQAATELTIKTPEDMTKATDILSKIKTIGKMVKERKEAITKPLNEALTSARDLFKPIEQNHAEAERIIKGKMIDYQEVEEKRQAEAKLKLAERVEKGTMKAETAVAKIEAMPEVAKTTTGKVGSVSFKTTKKYRVTDEDKVPREYMVPDIGKITEAIKAGKVVPGAEMYEVKEVSAR